jgi:hypothetical protein
VTASSPCACGPEVLFCRMAVLHTHSRRQCYLAIVSIRRHFDHLRLQIKMTAHNHHSYDLPVDTTLQLYNSCQFTDQTTQSNAHQCSSLIPNYVISTTLSQHQALLQYDTIYKLRPN